MSRRAQDPIDRAFANWRDLTDEQRQRLADRQYGWLSAQGKAQEPVRARRAKRRAAAAETTE